MYASNHVARLLGRDQDRAAGRDRLDEMDGPARDAQAGPDRPDWAGAAVRRIAFIDRGSATPPEAGRG